jgi:hypothetical protein
MPGPFGMPKRLKNSFSGLSSSPLSPSAVSCVVPTVLMLTTAGPARSTSAVKSGSRAAAVDATGEVIAAGAAAFATDSADVSRCCTRRRPQGRSPRLQAPA